MMIISNNNLFAINEEINRRYKIIKEYNFHTDIDLVKSDICYVHPSKNYLKCIFSSNYTVKNSENAIKIFGEAMNNEEEIVLTPTINYLNESLNDQVKRACIVIDKPIDIEKNELVNCNFYLDRSEHRIFFIIFFNKDTYDYWYALKDDIKKFDVKDAFSSDAEQIWVCFFGNALTVKKAIGMSDVPESIVSTSLSGPEVNGDFRCVINFERGQVSLNGGKEIISTDTLVFKEKKYMCLIMNTTDINDGRSMLIKDITYGNEKGYVYLKPYKPSEEKISFIMIHSGISILEYFNAAEDRWEKVSDESTVKVNESIDLRIKMGPGDKVFRILTVER